MTEFTMLLVEWTDVQSLDLGLCFPEDIPYEPVNCRLIGFLVKETKDCLFLAKEVWDNGMCKYIHTIPKKYIKERKEVM